MSIISEKSVIQKQIIQKIFLLVFSFSMQNVFASTVVLPQEIFETHVFHHYFNNVKSIDELQKTYYNFCLLSKGHNQITKEFWGNNWEKIMEQVCADYRYERIYFAGKFKNINEKIKYYFGNHVYLFDLFFGRNPYIQSLTPLCNCLGTMEARRTITIDYIKHVDPNFTTFGPNGQMSLLECAIKTHSLYFKKIEICTYLVNKGAQYDIWIPGILKKEKELASLNNDFSFFLDAQNTDAKFLKKMRKPMLLSYFIAYHKDLNYNLAKLIVKKGTAAQDDFIQRFPELERYRKEGIISPPIPPDFEIKNTLSLFRCYQLASLIPNFFKTHFGSNLYQAIDYQKGYKYYNKFSSNSDQKTMLDYISKRSQNATTEKKRLKIITVLKYDYLLNIICTIIPKRLKWLLIEFIASQEKKKVILLSMLFVIIHTIALVSTWQCIISLLNENHIKFFCHFLIVAFMLSLSSFMRFKEEIYHLKSKDTLYDPYYFIYL